MQKLVSMELDAILKQQQCFALMSVHYQFCRYKRCRIEGGYRVLFHGPIKLLRPENTGQNQYPYKDVPRDHCLKLW